MTMSAHSGYGIGAKRIKLPASQRAEDLESWYGSRREMEERVNMGTTAVPAVDHARLRIASQFAEMDDLVPETARGSGLKTDRFLVYCLLE